MKLFDEIPQMKYEVLIGMQGSVNCFDQNTFGDFHQNNCVFFIKLSYTS